MQAETTALILIGFQGDYFAEDGILTSFLEDQTWNRTVLNNTIQVLNGLKATSTLFVNTPIIFTPDYEELSEPTGILKAIVDSKAFRAGYPGSETIPELTAFGERIMTVPGKRGLNAFSNTALESLFKTRGITDVVLAGAVTSLCIDSTGRHAYELGMRVTILGDCTAGRTSLEQNFYCEQIFPLYAEVTGHADLLRQLS